MSAITIQQILTSNNVAELLDDTELTRIGGLVIEELERDRASMSDVLKSYESATKLAMLVAEPKSWPWLKASNVKMPLIANAAIKFAARAYPEIVRGTKVCKYEVFGKDQDDARSQAGQRIADFINWQLTTDMTEWEPDTDRLLTALAVIGQLYRKTYYSPALRRIVSELIYPADIIINAEAKTWAALRRVSHEFTMHANDMIENIRTGAYADYSKDLHADDSEENEYEVVEQHRWLDVDDDGYEEPYIVTVHKSTGKVLRIKPRFEPSDIRMSARNEIECILATEYFTAYGFLPPFNDSVLCIGLGTLLEATNESVNTIINQMIDAGTLNNMQGGLISKGIRIQGGNLYFDPGEWKFVDTGGALLKDSIFPLPKTAPSGELFNLMKTLIDSANDVASVKDILSGESPGANASPTTVLALIEQGQKTFNSIYKRIYRALAQELKLIYRLNAKYIDPKQYMYITEDPAANAKQDFTLDITGVLPVADPILSSQSQRLALAQAAMTMSGRPGIDEQYLTRSYLEAIGHPNVDKLMPPPPPGPSKEVVMEMAQLAKTKDELEQKSRELDLKEKEIDSIVAENLSAALKNMADAKMKLGSAEAIQYDNALNTLVSDFGEQNADTASNEGPVGGVAGAPGDGSPDGGAQPAQPANLSPPNFPSAGNSEQAGFGSDEGGAPNVP